MAFVVTPDALYKQLISKPQHFRLKRGERQFSAVVLCGFPFVGDRRTNSSMNVENGAFVLQITEHPHYRVPFGQGRIGLIFLVTLAVQQKSQIIRFKTASEMPGMFGISKGAKEYRRLVAAFKRIFAPQSFSEPTRSHQKPKSSIAPASISSAKLESGTTVHRMIAYCRRR
jgi:hypothetical protein